MEIYEVQYVSSIRGFKRIIFNVLLYLQQNIYHLLSTEICIYNNRKDDGKMATSPYG